MKSESWASYRAAMPPECFGEPDDTPEPDRGPPTWWAVETWEPYGYQDTIDGEAWVRISEAPCRRYFSRQTHAHPERSADRWAAAMAKRRDDVSLVCGWDDGEEFSHRVKP